MSDVNPEIRGLCKRFTITEYLAKRGVEVMSYGNSRKCRCPFPDHGGGTERTPSFNFRMSSDGAEVFKCFGCGRAGNIITLVAGLEGKKNGEVIRQLAKSAGVTLGEFDPAARVEPLNDAVVAAFCDEDDESVLISTICRQFIAVHNGSEDAVNRVCRVYEMLDDFLECGEGEYTRAKYGHIGVNDIYGIKDYVYRMISNYGPQE